MYRGRTQLGNHIWLGVLCHDDSQIPRAPTAAPTMEIWTATEKLRQGKLIPANDRFFQTGLFTYRLFLNDEFAAGQYQAIYRWITAGGYYGLEVDSFEIVPGGDATGNILAMTYFAVPQANYIVHFNDSGVIQKRRNPTL